MSCLFTLVQFLFVYILKCVCLLIRNLFMWDVSNQMKSNPRLKWIKTELFTKSAIWDFWKMFESDELDLLTGMNSIQNSVGSNPNVTNFEPLLNLMGQTSNSLEPRFVHQNQTLNSNPSKKPKCPTCSTRNWLNPGPNLDKPSKIPKIQIHKLWVRSNTK